MFITRWDDDSQIGVIWEYSHISRFKIDPALNRFREFTVPLCIQFNFISFYFGFEGLQCSRRRDSLIFSATKPPKRSMRTVYQSARLLYGLIIGLPGVRIGKGSLGRNTPQFSNGEKHYPSLKAIEGGRTQEIFANPQGNLCRICM